MIESEKEGKEKLTLTVSALTKIGVNVDTIEAMKDTRNGTSDLAIRALGEGAFARWRDGTREIDNERRFDGDGRKRCRYGRYGRFRWRRGGRNVGNRENVDRTWGSEFGRRNDGRRYRLRNSRWDRRDGLDRDGRGFGRFKGVEEGWREDGVDIDWRFKLTGARSTDTEYGRTRRREDRPGRRTREDSDGREFRKIGKFRRINLDSTGAEWKLERSLRGVDFDSAESEREFDGDNSRVWDSLNEEISGEVSVDRKDVAIS